MTNNTEETPPSSNNPKKVIIESAGITADQQIATSEATDKYSQYDPLVESKEHYEDALFSSEDELDAAITQGFNAPQAKPKENLETTPQPPQQPKAKDITKAINLSDCLSPHSLQKKFKSGAHLFSKGNTCLPVSHPASFDNPYGKINATAKEEYEKYASKLPVAVCGELPTEVKTVKSRLDSYKILAKYQLQKAQVAASIYFGQSLPARSVNFEYKPLKLKSEKQLGRLNTIFDIESLFKTKGIKPYQLLTEANHELAKLVKCNLSNHKKEKLLTCFTKYLSPLLDQMLISYNKRALSARNSQHGEIAELCHAIIKQIIIVYRQFYLNLYQAKPHIYGPQRNRANRLAYQLFDWLMYEQLFHAQTLSPIPEQSSKLASKLFYAIALCEPQEIKKSRASLCTSDTTDIEEQFILYQLLNIIDFQSINTKLHLAVMHQARQLCHHIKITPLNRPGLSNQLFEIDIEQGKLREANKNSSGIILNLSDFLTALESAYQKDLAELGSKSYDDHRFAPRHLLANSIKSWLEQRQPKHYTMYQSSNMRLFGGLENCFNHVAHHYIATLEKSKNKTASIEVPEPPTPAKTAILVAENTQAMLRIQLDESKVAININIGTPIICQEANSENNSTSNYLSLCQRVERNQIGMADLELVKLSDHYTAITISSMPAPNNKGILYTQEGRYFLIMYSAEKCWKGKVLDIELIDQLNYVICIKSLINNFGQLSLYELF